MRRAGADNRASCKARCRYSSRITDLASGMGCTTIQDGMSCVLAQHPQRSEAVYFAIKTGNLQMSIGVDKDGRTHRFVMHMQ